MNDEIKEILIDLVDYYNTMGTESDPGIRAFESVANRASKTLERFALELGEGKQINSADIDPFATTGEFEVYKREDEW